MLENGFVSEESPVRDLIEMREKLVKSVQLRCNGKIETATDAQLLWFINDFSSFTSIEQIALSIFHTKIEIQKLNLLFLDCIEGISNSLKAD